MVSEIAQYAKSIYSVYPQECNVCLATLVGAVIGFERELRGKAAGIRTYAIVAMAACLFTTIAKSVGAPQIAAQIVSGIGFLGAGIIWHQQDGTAEGLTTAASMWGVAAIGMAIGYDYMSLALTSAFTVLIIMELFGLSIRATKSIFKIKTEK